MEIPDAENVASVLVGDRMWSTLPENGVPGWASEGHWMSTRVFDGYLDASVTSGLKIVFYSPTGRVIS